MYLTGLTPCCHQIEDYFPVPTRTLSSVASTMGSASTPLPVTRNDSISLFNDDNEHTARNSDVFASDVEVSHPLRIGVGYGSYVCYSCTIYSSKVSDEMSGEVSHLKQILTIALAGSFYYCSKAVL